MSSPAAALQPQPAKCVHCGNPPAQHRKQDNRCPGSTGSKIGRTYSADTDWLIHPLRGKGQG